MPKKKITKGKKEQTLRSVELDDMLKDSDLTSNDMILLGANAEPVEEVQMSRLERIYAGAVFEEGELFTGETVMDAHIKVGSQDDVQKIRRDTLTKHRTEDDVNAAPVVENLRGEEPEDILGDVVEEFKTANTNDIKKRKAVRYQSEAVDEILADLHVQRKA